MARKPNYGLNRSDVNRAKQARQTEKLRAREEAVARRRATRDGSGVDETLPPPSADEDNQPL
jgi:hypothetical protein